MRWLFLSLLAVALLPCGRAAERAKTPFAAVTVRDHAIVATLPAGFRMVVTTDPAKSRVSAAGESFVLAEGAWLSLVEKHSSYLITVRLAPEPGVDVVARWWDLRSPGAGEQRKHSFIRATDAAETERLPRPTPLRFLPSPVATGMIP